MKLFTNKFTLGGLHEKHGYGTLRAVWYKLSGTRNAIFIHFPVQSAKDGTNFLVHNASD